MAAVDVRLQICRPTHPPTVLACGNWYHLLHCGLSSSMCDFASSVPPADVARTLRIPGKTRALLALGTRSVPLSSDDCQSASASAACRKNSATLCEDPIALACVGSEGSLS